MFLSRQKTDIISIVDLLHFSKGRCNMVEAIYNELKKITEEEKHILDGGTEIEKNLYMTYKQTEVDASKLLEAGKLIQIRPHTRFIHFPAHTHNYIEVIYMYCGSTQHIVDGVSIELLQGELVFLNQNAVQEISPAGIDDIAVNFIILPEFFDYALIMMGEEENLVRNFVIDCLRGKKESSSFLHFKVADILPIQNLVENLIWTIMNKQPNNRSINQATMGLLFLQLMNHLDRVEINQTVEDQKLVLSVLGYVEEHYREGDLAELAKELHYNVFWLSKEIKKRIGKTYIELIQEKRLNQAAYLLQHTRMSVTDIGMAIGYDNLSYFHRIFQKKYGETPRKYRFRTLH